VATNLTEMFGTWAKPLSDTEDDKCSNAEGMVRKAIGASAALRDRSIRVFAQGSYRNNTNVRAESDVDIGVCCTELINTNYSFVPGLTDAQVGLVNATYTHQQLRDDVGAALVAYFGSVGVSPGKKAFDVHSNSYRVDADVVPCVEHRRYASATLWHTGTAIYPTSGGVIVNWPEQNYANGVEKNGQTETSYKKLVRIIKNLRNRMSDEGDAAAVPIPSYLLECLVWNVPNEGFMHSSYEADVRYILTFLFSQLSDDSTCSEWGEVNKLKYLFRASQPWKRSEAHDFVRSAMKRLGMSS
jgi:hypothetical protein